MSVSFGSKDVPTGPTAAEIAEEQRKQAERRRRGLRQEALRSQAKGVQGLLLGSRSNPSFRLPGGNG